MSSFSIERGTSVQICSMCGAQLKQILFCRLHFGIRNRFGGMVATNLCLPCVNKMKEAITDATSTISTSQVT